MASLGWSGTAAAMLVVASTAQAGPPKDIMCNAVMKTPEGKFTYGQLPGLSIVRAVNEDGPFKVEGQSNIVGFACARTSVVPIVNDVKVLQAGYSLSIGDNRGGMNIVDFRLENGKVVYKITAGSLSEKQQKQIDKVVLEMQQRIGQPKSAS